MNQKIMFSLLNKNSFDIMFDAKINEINSVLKQYKVTKQELYNTLWTEFNISGMEVRIANTAFDFLIDCCKEKRELKDTLKGEIKKNILMSCVFYTNVAPNAAHTTDFNL